MASPQVRTAGARIGLSPAG